jgi:hypothetical protein
LIFIGISFDFYFNFGAFTVTTNPSRAPENLYLLTYYRQHTPQPPYKLKAETLPAPVLSAGAIREKAPARGALVI